MKKIDCHYFNDGALKVFVVLLCFFSHKISPLLGAIIKVLELLLNWVVCKLVFTTEKKITN